MVIEPNRQEITAHSIGGGNKQARMQPFNHLPFQVLEIVLSLYSIYMKTQLTIDQVHFHTWFISFKNE